MFFTPLLMTVQLIIEYLEIEKNGPNKRPIRETALRRKLCPLKLAFNGAFQNWN